LVQIRQTPYELYSVLTHGSVNTYIRFDVLCETQQPWRAGWWICSCYADLLQSGGGVIATVWRRWVSQPQLHCTRDIFIYTA